MATITVSEETAERLYRVADTRGLDPEELILEFLDHDGEDASWSPPLSPDDMESIRQGLEDSDAGRVVDTKTLFAELDARIEALKRGEGFAI